MTPEQKESCNRFLCEWMGECWHEWATKSDAYPRVRCSKCGKFYINTKGNPNYFTPKGFFAIWNEAKESGEWGTFLMIHGRHWRDSPEYDLLQTNLIDPLVFIPKWARFLGWKEVPDE